jgi:UDP-N-acetylglucosamine:LPS N-acetylglucosamine transferase
MNCLSRLHADQLKSEEEEKLETNEFLGIVSGPEPQRTLLENIFWQQGNDIGAPFVVVAGLPDNTTYHKKSESGILYGHLNGKDLATEIKHAKYIICRGGYTTLMELIPFYKKLILVPTPGQTEQAYLAQYWQEKKWAITFSQNEFKVQTAIEKASQFDYQSPPFIEFSTIALARELKQLSL